MYQTETMYWNRKRTPFLIYKMPTYVNKIEKGFICDIYHRDNIGLPVTFDTLSSGGHR